MTWMEKNFNSDSDLIRDTLEKCFEKYYHRTESDQRFLLPDGSAMKIVILHWEDEHSFVMDYKSETDWDDGDQFFPSDYESFEMLFEAMLEETQRTEEEA